MLVAKPMALISFIVDLFTIPDSVAAGATALNTGRLETPYQGTKVFKRT